MVAKDPPLIERLRGSSAAETINALHGIYLEAEAATARFSLMSGIACSSDCGGVCCKGFEPDATEAEALYLAAWIIESGADPEAAIPRGPADGEYRSPDGAGCPFWDRSGSGRCKVYPGRGLICRLFGFSALRGADGEKSFALCFAMDRSHSGPRKWREGDGDFFEIADPPVMADYGARVAALSPGGGREGLGGAVAKALAKLTLILRFGGSPGNDPGGEGPLSGGLGPARGAA